MLKILFASFIFFVSSLAHARVFSFKEESLAVYFGGSAGYLSLNQGAFKNSSGSLTTKFSDGVTYSPAIELGASLKVEKVTFKFAAEILQTNTLRDVSGKNTSGTELMSLTSKVFVFNPNLVIEFTLMQKPQSRSFFGLGAGMAKVSVDNTYALTSAGQTAYSGLANYTDKTGASSISYSVHFGQEYHFIDNVTFMYNLGYRYMNFTALEYKTAATAFQGAVAKGDAAKLNDGTNRGLDMSSVFFGVSFRFYISRP